MSSEQQLSAVIEFLRSEDGPRLLESLRKSCSAVNLLCSPGFGPGLWGVYVLYSNRIVLRVFEGVHGETVLSEHSFDLGDWFVLKTLLGRPNAGWKVIPVDKLRAMLPQPAVRKTR